MKNKKTRFFKIEAARRATQTKTTNRLFQKKPPGRVTNKNDKPFFQNIDKIDVTSKNHDPNEYKKNRPKQSETW